MSLLTVKAARKVCGNVSKSFMYSANGPLGDPGFLVIRLGRRVFVDEDTLRDWLAAHAAKPAIASTVRSAASTFAAGSSSSFL